MFRTRQAVVVGLVTALVGCTLTQSELRKGAALLPTMSTMTGQPIGPKQCALKMAIVDRPVGDAVLGASLWDLADDQAVDEGARQALAANGLRVGVVTGGLPAAVQAIFDEPPPRQISPATVVLPDGDSTLVNLETHRDELSLLMALQERSTVAGKRYSDVNGFLRLTAHQEGEDTVVLRIMPELHHGPVQQGWGVASGGGGSNAPQQYVVHNGQKEETFRELLAGLKLRPGQVAIISARTDRKGSLGHFLFTTAEANSDRLTQKTLFVWASRYDMESSRIPGVERALPPALEPVDPPEMPETGEKVSETRSRRRAKPRVGLAAGDTDELVLARE